MPIAVTIAGLDSSGGAGLAVDLQTFSAFGVSGRCAATAFTAQSPHAVLAVQGARPAVVTAQLESVFAGRRPRAAKCGMLFSGGVVEAVADFWTGRKTPLVVDPVLASSSGTALLNVAGVRAMKKRLLPHAKLVTPNVPEAEQLSKIKIREPEDMRTAARAIFEKFGCATFITGGHLAGREIVEIFFDGREELLLTKPRARVGPRRGTGCRLSAAVTAELAKRSAMQVAVCRATEWVGKAMAGGNW